LIAISAGMAVGVYFGWIYTPQKISNTSLSSLRSDYSTDYVLMVSETYGETKDLALASFQLAYLGAEKPLYFVQKAIISGESLGYTVEDMVSLANLASAFQTLEEPIQTP